MASESIAHSAFGLMAIDSEPIRARGIIVNNSLDDLSKGSGNPRPYLDNFSKIVSYRHLKKSLHEVKFIHCFVASYPGCQKVFQGLVKRSRRVMVSSPHSCSSLDFFRLFATTPVASC